MTGSFPSVQHTFKPKVPSHSYHRRRLGCPCPGLAILINHAYLKPIDEHDPINVTRLATALVQCFNLSWIHATFLSLLACFLCGSGLSVSIAQLGIHGKIEHDASITRHNYGKGDCNNPDEKLIHRFLSRLASPHQVTLEDYALRRAQLQASERKGLSLKTKFTALGEVGLTMAVFAKDHRCVDSASLNTIFSEERLPEGWVRPTNPVSIKDALMISWNLHRKIQLFSPTKRPGRRSIAAGPIGRNFRSFLDYFQFTILAGYLDNYMKKIT